MDDQLLTSLLIDLKSNLRITWDEEDERLKKMIDSAYLYLSALTGTELDVAKEHHAKTLLLERCRYVYNNVADEFEKNYQHELSRLILSEAVKVGGNNEATL